MFFEPQCTTAIGIQGNNNNTSLTVSFSCHMSLCSGWHVVSD